MESLSRTEAADRIAAAIEADGYSASTWTPEGNGGPVRVYVTIPAANWKKKAQKIGHVAVNLDGSVESNLDKQSGSIMALLPDLQITPVTPAAKAPTTTPEHKDEDVAAFEASERATGAAEQNREQG